MISNISGSFTKFEAKAETSGDDFSSASINLSAEMSSISTNQEQRDAHLRTTDFFEVDKYPRLLFRSTRIEKKDSDSFIVYGDLTLKGITKPVKLNVDVNGITRDPWGHERAGFTVNGKINRNDWGVTFNKVLETGGVALSDEVKILADVQFVKEAVAVPA